jgi:hypothetical protein
MEFMKQSVKRKSRVKVAESVYSLDYGLDKRNLTCRRASYFFPFPLRHEQIWATPILLYDENWGLFPWR